MAPPGRDDVVPALVRPRQLGGVLLADYRSGTLRYHELIVFSRATPRGMVVSHIYVDSPSSRCAAAARSGGCRRSWPSSSYDRGTFTARQDGDTLLRARIRRRRGRLPLLIPTPITSPAGDTVGRARITAAPALVALEVPEGSPFAALGLAGTQVALAGDDLRLTMPAPPRVR